MNLENGAVRVRLARLGTPVRGRPRQQRGHVPLDLPGLGFRV